MEGWQINYIHDNFLALCKQTKCSTKLVCLLLQRKMINLEEKTTIKTAYINYGTTAGSRFLYKSLLTRVDGYAKLQKCLDEDRQTIPADILAKGYRICQQPVPGAQQEHAYIDDYHQHYFEKPLKVSINYSTQSHKRQMAEDIYNLPRDKKGIAFVASICEFDFSNYRDGGHIDAELMLNVFQGLGYKIYEPCLRKPKCWTKETLISCIDQMIMMCDKEHEQDRPKSIVIFISSHGLKDYIAATDSETSKYEASWIHLEQDILFKFHNRSEDMPSGAKYLSKVPKIFLINACQILPKQRDAIPEVVVQPFENAILVLSQVAGHYSYRHSVYGSYFPHILAYVLMKYACEKHLWELLKMADRILRSEKLNIGQALTITPFALENLYFNI